MAINVSAANSQAAQISNESDRLKVAKAHLCSYRDALRSSWQADETAYYIRAINDAIDKIDKAIRDMQSLSGDIKNTAAQIKREEEERIRRAQIAYDDARRNLDKLRQHRQNLINDLGNYAPAAQAGVRGAIQALESQIVTAERNCNSKYTALQNAKR